MSSPQSRSPYRSRFFLPALALGLVALLAPGGASAQDNSAAREAGKRRVEAQVAFNKAQQNLNIIAQRIRGQHETRPEWVAAANEHKTAQKNYEQAVSPVREKVRGSEEYKKLVAEKVKVDEELARLRERRSAQAQVVELATKSVDLSSQMSKMEFDAISADAKVAEAKKAVSTAAAKLTELRQAADDSMRGDPQWQDARKLVDDAQVKLNEANKAVADAQKSAAEAARAAAASRRPSRSRN